MDSGLNWFVRLDEVDDPLEGHRTQQDEDVEGHLPERRGQKVKGEHLEKNQCCVHLEELNFC